MSLGYRSILSSKSRFDPDALAFIVATGITDSTQQTAINTLVLSLKSNNLWTKMKAIYPFVGGTAFTHKFNLIDPRDLDVAFRVNFVGIWNHNSNGVQGVTTHHADTNINASTVLTLNNTSFSVYSRTNISQASIDIGVNSSNTNRIAFHFKWTDNNCYQDQYNITTNRITFSLGSNPSTRLMISNRSSSTLFNLWRDGTKLATDTDLVSNTLPNANIYFGARNQLPTVNAVDSRSTREYAFIHIGEGLTDTDATNLTTIVNTYQTTLGRNV